MPNAIEAFPAESADCFHCRDEQLDGKSLLVSTANRGELTTLSRSPPRSAKEDDINVLVEMTGQADQAQK